MAKRAVDTISQKKLSKKTYVLFDITQRESLFITIVAILFFIAGSISPYPQVAMWFGFMMAAYSAIANDSIQTIGTFIASNQKRQWYYLWLFMGGVFLATVTYSWVTYNGDVSWQRLQSPGLETAPTSFSFLQLAAPIILLILTRLRMPVSTSILLLSSFSTKGSTIISILEKSLSGYFIAFILAFVVWMLVVSLMTRFLKKKPAPYWIYLQWLTSGALWAAWIVQDAANVAVVLPRTLTLGEFLFFAGFIFFGLGFLFYMKGDKIQEVVNEKSGVTDVRAATLVDFVYAIILFYFKEVSVIPMSTTWVFIGLLGGRELAISLTKNRKKKRSNAIRKSFKMIGRDALFAFIGLLVSLILAIAINESVRKDFFAIFE